MRRSLPLLLGCCLFGGMTAPHAGAVEPADIADEVLEIAEIDRGICTVVVLEDGRIICLGSGEMLAASLERMVDEVESGDLKRAAVLPQIQVALAEASSTNDGPNVSRETIGPNVGSNVSRETFVPVA